jgi:hypothetical protein
MAQRAALPRPVAHPRRIRDAEAARHGTLEGAKVEQNCCAGEKAIIERY